MKRVFNVGNFYCLKGANNTKHDNYFQEPMAMQQEREREVS